MLGRSATDGTNIRTSALTAASLPEGFTFSSFSKKIFWSELSYTGARLHLTDTSVTQDSVFLPNGSVIRGMAIDKDSNWVYYATSNLNTNAKIERIHPDGTGYQTFLLLDNTTGNPRALAIDPTARKLYWTEFTQGTIKRMDLTLGATQQTVVSGLNGPVGLGVYHTGGLLFWAEANANVIRHSDLNGGSMATIALGLATPNYLTLDTVNDILYWTEIGTPRIQKASFAGTGLQTLPISVSHPTGIILLSQAELLLPVELSSFTATVKNSAAALSWKSATEVNNYGFEIEKREIQKSELRNEKVEWVKIGFVKGNGTSNSPKKYSYTDASVSSGTYAYRLKQIDNDGAFKYSQETEVTIAVPTKFSLGQNYPNPFNPTTIIRYDIPNNLDKVLTVSLRVYDIVGREVATLVNEIKEAGSYEVQFDASKFASGVYFYRLKTGNYTAVKKLVLMK
jgi:hypothetical protein